MLTAEIIFCLFHSWNFINENVYKSNQRKVTWYSRKFQLTERFCNYAISGQDLSIVYRTLVNLVEEEIWYNESVWYVQIPYSLNRTTNCTPLHSYPLVSVEMQQTWSLSEAQKYYTVCFHPQSCIHIYIVSFMLTLYLFVFIIQILVTHKPLT